MRAPGTYDASVFEELWFDDVMKFIGAVAIVLTVVDILILVFG